MKRRVKTKFAYVCRLPRLVHFGFFLSVLVHRISNTIHFLPQEENPNCTQTEKPSRTAALISILFAASITFAMYSPVQAAGGDIMAPRSTDDSWYMSVVRYGWQGPDCVYDQYGYCLRNCTSYVAQRLAQAGVEPNAFDGLGNGGEWYSNARQRGIRVGDRPVEGAVAVSPEINHSAYVEKVHSDGSVNVKSYSGHKEEPWHENGTRRYSKFVYFSNTDDRDDGQVNESGERFKGNKLSKDQELRRGEYIASGNLQFKLIFNAKGNLVLYHNDNVFWHSRTGKLDGKRAIMQSDGNFVIYKDGGIPVWSSGTYDTGADRVKMQSDGNLVIYAGRDAKWSSRTAGHRTFSYFGSDNLLSGQTLKQGQFLRSENGRYALRLQRDGNLVLYSAGYHVLWHSQTGGSDANRLVMQGDGNLVLYHFGSPKWATNTVDRGYRAVVQSDGNFVVYKSGDSFWASDTAGQI